MPELPEVETIRKDLASKIIGKFFLDVIPLWSGIVKGIGLSDFRKKIIGSKIKSIQRRAKNLIFELELSPNFKEKIFILIHLKMTGHLLVISDQWAVDQNGKWQTGTKELLGDPQNQFIRIIFKLSSGLQLAFSDLRKFAYIKLVNEKGLKENLKEYGPEVLEISFEEFANIVKEKNSPIKKILMDQKVLAGIGNIYSDEILFKASIHPLRKANSLKQEELKKIYQSIGFILNQALKERGTSISDFRNISGERGRYDKIRQVYRREGGACKRCGQKIKCLKIGGRSSYFCPGCQK